MESEETIGNRIKKWRELRGWKRPQLVKALGEFGVVRTSENIRLYEIDEQRPPPEVRKALAAVFGKTEQEVEFGEMAKTEAKSARSPPTVTMPLFTNWFHKTVNEAHELKEKNEALAAEVERLRRENQNLKRGRREFGVKGKKHG